MRKKKSLEKRGLTFIPAQVYQNPYNLPTKCTNIEKQHINYTPDSVRVHTVLGASLIATDQYDTFERPRAVT